MLLDDFWDFRKLEAKIKRVFERRRWSKKPAKSLGRLAM